MSSIIVDFCDQTKYLQEIELLTVYVCGHNHRKPGRKAREIIYYNTTGLLTVIILMYVGKVKAVASQNDIKIQKP